MTCKFQIIKIAALFISATATGQDTTSTAGEIVQTKSGPVKVERLATLGEPWGMTASRLKRESISTAAFVM